MFPVSIGGISFDAVLVSMSGLLVPSYFFFVSVFEVFCWLVYVRALIPSNFFLAGFVLVFFLRAEKGSISAVRTCMRVVHALAVCVEQPDDEGKSAECGIVCS